MQLDGKKSKIKKISGEIAIEQLQQNAAEAVILLKAIANETRLLIVCNLLMGERSVSNLIEVTQMGQSALSQHLTILRRERLIRARKEAQSVYYSLASDKIARIVETLHQVYCE